MRAGYFDQSKCGVRRLLLTFVVAAMMATTGCDSLLGETEDDGTVTKYAYTAHIESRGMRTTMVLDQAGIVVLPDREYARFRVQLGSFSMDSETIRVGASRWVRGDLPFIEAGLGPKAFLATTDGAATRQALADVLAGQSGTPETVNGVAALRYTLTGAQLIQVATSVAAIPDSTMPPEATLWVSADSRMPVRMAMEYVSEQEPGSLYFEVNVTRVNDPSLVVEAPRQAPASASTGDTGGASKSLSPEADGWDYVKGILGSIIGTVTGVDPFSVNDAVDIVEENAESLAETKENAEEYFDAYPDPDEPDRDRYTLADEDLSNKTGLYRWFWSLFE